MKRIITLVLSMVCVLGLVGCGEKAVENVIPVSDGVVSDMPSDSDTEGVEQENNVYENLSNIGGADYPSFVYNSTVAYTNWIDASKVLVKGAVKRILLPDERGVALCRFFF